MVEAAGERSKLRSTCGADLEPSLLGCLQNIFR